MLPLTAATPGSAAAAQRRDAHAAWWAALLLAICAAFDPMCYVLLAPLAFIALLVAVARRSVVRSWRAVVLIVIPPVLLLPWSARVWHHPALLATGVGQAGPGLQSSRPAPVDVLLMHPAAPGLPPVWLDVVVVVAALVALLRRDVWTVRTGWLVAAIGVVGGIVVSRTHVNLPADGGEVVGWPGAATAVVGAGLLIAASIALTGLRSRLRTANFGWRQPMAVVLVGAAGVTPAVAAALWIHRGTGALLHAGSPAALPAFVADPTTTHDAPRTLVLQLRAGASSGANSALTYAMVRDRLPQLGEADLPPDPRQVAVVDTAVSDLAGGFGQRAATELAHAGVRYVLAPASGDAGLGTRLAGAGGLLRHGDVNGWQVWEVEAKAGRLAIATPGRPEWQLATDAAGSIGRHSPPLSIPYGPPPRLLVLAEAPSPDWLAVTGAGAGNKGVPLAATTYEGMQAFALPPAGGQVVVSRVGDRRADWLGLQLGVLIVVLLAAIPTGPRTPPRQPAAAGDSLPRARAVEANPIGAPA